MVDEKRAAEQLELHEGLRTHAYLDTEGNWTVGVGYNLTGRGVYALETLLGRKFRCPLSEISLSADEARSVLRADIARLDKAIPVYFPKYTALSEVRQRVVLDMAFNMGFKALGFTQTRKYIEQEKWSEAARELFKSRWARQVGDGEDQSPEAARARGAHFDRCDRLSKMLLTNLDWTA